MNERTTQDYIDTCKLFQKGENVHVDNNPYSFVEVVSQSPKHLFTRVRNPKNGYEWELMTNRLTSMEEMREKTKLQ